jgi:hypothetical protein
MKIHEVTAPDGGLSGIYLRLDSNAPETLEIVDAGGALPVPEGALEKVLARYGAPFDPEARIIVVAELALGPGKRLRHVQHLAGYDVVMRDYLVLDAEGGEPLCAPGATVAAALQHLASAWARTPPPAQRHP